MLNIAGPEYDFGHVVYAVLEECEHRRRSYDDEDLHQHLMRDAKAKLSLIRQAYDEFGGSAAYWKALEKEVLETAMPQYLAAAREMNELERTSFGAWRGGDPASRGVFALGGLFLGTLIIRLPTIAPLENMAALALTVAGAFYPEIKRFTHERRHAKLLNRLVADAARYQQDSKLHYMTTAAIRESFSIAPPRGLDEAIDVETTTEHEKLSS